MVAVLVGYQYAVELVMSDAHLGQPPQNLAGAHTGVDEDVGFLAGYQYGVTSRAAAENGKFHMYLALTYVRATDTNRCRGP